MGLILNRRRELGYILTYDKEIEYLESSGTQCIDTLVQLYTGEEATYEIDIKAYQPTGAAHMGIILNTMYEVNPYPGVVLRYESNYNCVFCIDMSDKTNVCPPEETFEYKIIKNNITSQTHQATVTLFGGYDGNGDLWRFDTCKIYYCKIYDHDTLVRDLIPVRVGQVGYMFDRVTRQLFGNIGTGNFILGPDIDNIVLPYDAEIEYLQSDGTAWINPNVSAVGGTIIDADFAVLSYGDIFPCMSHNSTGDNGYDRNFFRVNSATNINCMKCGESTNVTCTFGTNERHTFYYNTIGTNFIGKLDGIDSFNIASSSTLASTAGGLGIFRNMYNSTSIANCKLYGLKLYNSAQTFLRDFIPVRVGSTGCLYDKISGKLFLNSAGGNFSLGQDIKLTNNSSSYSNVLLKLERTLADKSIYNRTTTTTGTVTSSYNGLGIFIDGTNGGSGLILDTTLKNVILNKDYSISLDVICLTSKINNYATIISLGGSNSSGGVVGIQMESGSGAYFYASGMRINYDNSGFNYNTWYHLEFRRQNGVFSLLLNGILKGTTDYAVTNNVSDIVIGYNQSASSERINGYVKNILIELL